MEPILRSSCYTGIGSRQTPEIWRDVFANVGSYIFNEYGLTLRSGAADGADTFFEKSKGSKNIYLPSYRFNSRTTDNQTYFNLEAPLVQRYEPIIKQCCPHWDNIKRPNVRNLLLRNMAQILGHNSTCLELSRFVLCWTPDGEYLGGTRYALWCADLFECPIFNFGKYNPTNYVDDLLDFFEEHAK